MEYNNRVICGIFHVRTNFYENLKYVLGNVTSPLNIYFYFVFYSGHFFKVSLTSPLSKGKTATYDVESSFSHVLKPFPKEIGQSDKQLVVYIGNTVVYSPYEIKEQKTTVKLSSAVIESYSRLKPSSSSDSSITYGPYKNSKTYRTHEMRVHFENNSPFLTISEMLRWIEVSHWGNVAVEETYHMKHQGAQLKVHKLILFFSYTIGCVSN